MNMSNSLLFMFVKVNNFLNLVATTSSQSIETPIVDMGDSLFDGPSCPAKFLEFFLVAKLLMFCLHFVTLEECAYPLLWRMKKCHTWHGWQGKS
jgi:hypothetical protein